MPALQDCLFPAAGNLFPPEISVKAERKNENRRLSGLSLMRLLSRALRFIMRRVNRASMSILTAAVSAMPLLFVHLCFKDFWSLREEMLESDGARKKLLRAVYYAYMSKEKFFIGSKAVFSSKPVFPHGTAGVFISEGARFGTCCTIYQHATIGSNTIQDSRGKGSPTIGDNCIIGAGAAVIGDVTIGNNCRIGANCTVVESILDNCVVVPQRPRIIEKDAVLNNTWHPY